MSAIQALPTVDRFTIGELLDYAYADQQQYVNYGSPESDYSDDDSESINAKIEQYRRFGEIGALFGFEAEVERWKDLGNQFIEAILGPITCTECGQSASDLCCEEETAVCC